MYEFVTVLCRQQAAINEHHDNANIRGVGQDEATRRNYKRLNFGGGQAYDRLSN
jgi:hypothetical protein